MIDAQPHSGDDPVITVKRLRYIFNQASTRRQRGDGDGVSNRSL